jgi:hypothetical protein
MTRFSNFILIMIEIIQYLPDLADVIITNLKHLVNQGC